MKLVFGLLVLLCLVGCDYNNHGNVTIVTVNDSILEFTNVEYELADYRTDGFYRVTIWTESDYDGPNKLTFSPSRIKTLTISNGK